MRKLPRCPVRGSGTFVVVHLLFFALPAVLVPDEWQPPIKPDPEAVIAEARKDVAAKRYKIALAKYVWFFENAMKIDASFSGIRNSHAVAEWRHLGSLYPPALTKLRETRDSAVRKLKRGAEEVDAFDDVAAINHGLREEDNTVELFRFLDVKKPKIAARVFLTARKSLIAKKRYKLCGKYTTVKEVIPRLKKTILSSRAVLKSPGFSPEQKAEIKRTIITFCTTDIAILVMNDRKKDATSIAKAIRKEWDDEAFHEGVDKALKGRILDV